MKTLLFAVLLLIACPLVSLADTTSEFEIISGADTIFITDNGAGDLNPANGTIAYSNSNFNGWNIFFSSGSTNSPSLSPFGLDLAALTATCAGGPCANAPLEVVYSDINFGTPVGVNGFETTFSSTQNGNGTTSESAWFGNNDVLFSMQNLIGDVGPFSGSSVGQAFGGAVAAVPNYSLTLEQVFTDSNHTVSFSVDGNIDAVTPEPSSGILVLVGLLLITLVGMVRGPLRRKF